MSHDEATEFGSQQSHEDFSSHCEQLRLAPKKDMVGLTWNQLARRLIDHLPAEELIKVGDALAIGNAESVMTACAEYRAPDDGAPNEGLEEDLVLGIPFDPEGRILLDILQIATMLFQEGQSDLVRDVLGGSDGRAALHIPPDHLITLIDGKDF